MCWLLQIRDGINSGSFLDPQMALRNGSVGCPALPRRNRPRCHGILISGVYWTMTLGAGKKLPTNLRNIFWEWLKPQTSWVSVSWYHCVITPTFFPSPKSRTVFRWIVHLECDASATLHDCIYIHVAGYLRRFPTNIPVAKTETAVVITRSIGGNRSA